MFSVKGPSILLIDDSFMIIYFTCIFNASLVQSRGSKRVKMDGRPKVDGLEPNWAVI